MREEAGEMDVLLSRYLDGDMTQGEVEAFEVQLTSDSALQEEAEAFRQLDTIAREVGSPPPVDDVRWRECWSKIEERIVSVEDQQKIVPMIQVGAEAASIRSDGIASRIVGLAAAALLTASVGLYLLPETGPGTTPAAGGSQIAFTEAPGANAVEVVEISSADGFQPSVVFPEDDSQPVMIMLHEL